jgi:hypothetical protein
MLLQHCRKDTGNPLLQWRSHPVKRETFQYYRQRITVLLNPVDHFVVQALNTGAIDTACEHNQTKL